MTQGLVRRQDGRAARGERARHATVDALLALLAEGAARPSVAQIAERAGVSTRLVFHHFDGLEELFTAAAERQLARLTPPRSPGPSPEAALPPRLKAFVDERARVYELLAPARRAAVVVAPLSPALAERLRQSGDAFRADLERTFAAELALRPPAERRELACALEAATSFAAWEQLRRAQGVDLALAKRSLVRVLVGLLGVGRPAPRPTKRRRRR